MDTITTIPRTEILAESDKHTDIEPEVEKPAHVPGQVIEVDEIPPPPGDWVSHPVTRTIGVIILLGLIALVIIKFNAVLDYIHAHPLGSGLVAFAACVGIGLIFYAYWRFRAVGEVGSRYWDTERKRRKL